MGGMPVKGNWWGPWCAERGYKSSDIKAINIVKWTNEHNTPCSAYQIEMPDGELVKFRRVTTVLKMDPEVMKGWVLREIKTALKESWQEGLTYTQDEIDRNISWVLGAPERKKEWAAGIGTRVHQLIDTKLRFGYYGAPDPVTGELVSVDLEREEEGVQNAIVVWEEWYTKHPLEVLEIEKVVVSFRFGFCGQFDFLCRDLTTGRKFLLDWKTGKDLYADYILQQTAYGAAMIEMGLGLPSAGKALWVGRNADVYRELVCWNNPQEWKERFRFYVYLCELYEADKMLQRLAEGKSLRVTRRPRAKK